MTTSPRQILDLELNQIRDRVLRMGELLDRAIRRAMRAVETHDHDLARQVVEDDVEINELRFEIEAACTGLIATQQPAAGDLRQVIAAMNIILDLERMADHAAGIAKAVLRMGKSVPQRIPDGLDRLAELAVDMLRRAMQAYSQSNTDVAYAIAAEDDLVDEQYRRLFRELLESMIKQREAAESDLYLMFAGHNLERIADRATNIAERVVFMASGELEELNISGGLEDGPGEERLAG